MIVTIKYIREGKSDAMARILVVDDAAFMRMTIRQMIEPQGHEVVGEAGTGVEAIEMYSKVKPEVVLMDITMPDMNGIEAVKRIKELDNNAKVIMCSAVGQQMQIAEAIKNGAENFIVKPFQKETLYAAINKVLGK